MFLLLTRQVVSGPWEKSDASGRFVYLLNSKVHSNPFINKNLLSKTPNYFRHHHLNNLRQQFEEPEVNFYSVKSGPTNHQVLSQAPEELEKIILQDLQQQTKNFSLVKDGRITVGDTEPKRTRKRNQNSSSLKITTKPKRPLNHFRNKVEHVTPKVRKSQLTLTGEKNKTKKQQDGNDVSDGKQNLEQKDLLDYNEPLHVSSKKVWKNDSISTSIPYQYLKPELITHSIQKLHTTKSPVASKNFKKLTQKLKQNSTISVSIPQLRTSDLSKDSYNRNKIIFSKNLNKSVEKKNNSTNLPISQAKKLNAESGEDQISAQSFRYAKSKKYLDADSNSDGFPYQAKSTTNKKKFFNSKESVKMDDFTEKAKTKDNSQ